MPLLTRREMLKAAGMGLVGYSASGWLPVLAEQLATNPQRRRHCVLLWMNGGPSQTDTFDMKPGHSNGGEFKEVATNVAGLRFSEHLPKLAQQADQLAIIRGLSTKEGDHGRGTYLMRTGQQPAGPIQYPSIGASISKELGRDVDEVVPHFVSISPYRAFNLAAYGSGFLGPKHAPITVSAADSYQQPADVPSEQGFAELRVDDLEAPAGVELARVRKRMDIWRSFQDDFLVRRPTAAVVAHEQDDRVLAQA